MTIYIDTDFKCYTENASGRTATETDFFDERPKTFIEGYRYIPSGSTWTREDGKQFKGEAVFPYVDYSKLDYANKGFDDRDEEVAELLDTIEDLCNELIGE